MKFCHHALLLLLKSTCSTLASKPPSAEGRGSVLKGNLTCLPSWMEPYYRLNYSSAPAEQKCHAHYFQLISCQGSIMDGSRCSSTRVRKPETKRTQCHTLLQFQRYADAGMSEYHAYNDTLYLQSNYIKYVFTLGLYPVII